MPKKMEIMRYICYIISLVSLKKFYKIYFIKVDRNISLSRINKYIHNIYITYPTHIETINNTIISNKYSSINILFDRIL